MRFYQTNQTEIVLVFDDGIVPIPATYIDMVEIDETQNPNLYPDFISSIASYRVTSGKLMKNGVAVTINVPGTNFTDRQAALSLLSTIADEISTLDQGISGYAGMTNTQKQTFVINNFERIMKENRAFLKIIRWIIRVYIKLV